jgi:hypothetical protein
VDLASASIRPAQEEQWFATVRQRIMDAASKTSARVRLLTGTWEHDLAQANLLHRPRPGAAPAGGKRLPPPPEPELEAGVTVDVQPVGSHRLALALDQQGKLLPLVQNAVLAELGIKPPPVRLANLL